MNKPNAAKIKKAFNENYLPIAVGLLGLGVGVAITAAAAQHDLKFWIKQADGMAVAYVELANFACEHGVSAKDVFDHALKNGFTLIPVS